MAPSAAHSTYSESDLASVDSVFVDREPLHMTNVKAFTGSFESQKVCFVGTVRYLLQTSFVVLALRSEHLKLFFQTFQCFFDSLLTFVTLLISGFEISGQNFTVERKCIELLLLPA